MPEIPLLHGQEQVLRTGVEREVVSENDHEHHHVEQGHDRHQNAKVIGHVVVETEDKQANHVEDGHRPFKQVEADKGVDEDEQAEFTAEF